MREIEIKASVADKTALLSRIKSLGMKITEPVAQRDQVFGLPGKNGGDGSSLPWLRIRTETKNSEVQQIFTLKKSVTNQMDSIEHETEIVDAGELAKIIQHIGFTPYSDSTKTRQKAHDGDIEICIDTVDGLGDFIEAEKLTEEDVDYKAIIEELWNVLERLGVARVDEVTDGYDVLMRKRQGLEE
jgi:adenylate cyclase class 2